MSDQEYYRPGFSRCQSCCGDFDGTMFTVGQDAHTPFCKICSQWQAHIGLNPPPPCRAKDGLLVHQYSLQPDGRWQLQTIGHWKLTQDDKWELRAIT